MHRKYNNKSSNFIQGLRPFSSSIPKTLKKYLKKGGYNYSNIVDNWTQIVSKKISDSCYPITIKMSKEMKNGTLVLNVIHGKELEIEYEKEQIKDQINSFFGYRCIDKIILKIVEEKFNKQKRQLIKIKDLSKLNKKISEVSNDQLKSALNNFLEVFNEKNK